METNCIHCGKAYDTKRESSLYCSNSCRTSAYKYRKRCEQFEKEQQTIRQAQKEKDDQQKLIDDEKRTLKAAKRKKAREEKALKALQENEKIASESSHVEADIPEFELPPEDLSKQPEKPEKIAELPQIPRVLNVQQRLEFIKKNSGRTKHPTLGDIINEITKYYNNRNK